MIENISLGSIMGAPAVGPDDEKIGTVGQVFVDPASGAPNWATVHTGLFGRHENFVPLDQATWDREKLHLPFGKDRVKDAPRIDADEALSPESEAELYRYYGITPDVPLGAADDLDDGAEQRSETHAEAEGARHHDAEAAAAGAEYAQQSRMQRYAASGNTDDDPDAVFADRDVSEPGDGAEVASGDAVSAPGDDAVAAPVSAEPAHADAPPHDGESRGPRHRA